MIGPTVEVLQATTVVDEYSGEETAESWDTFTIIGSYLNTPVFPRISDEPGTMPRPRYVIVGLQIILPYTAHVTGANRVRVLSGPYAGTWRVEAQPGYWQNPLTGWQACCEVMAVERVSG